jgi:hypothetical protein
MPNYALLSVGQMAVTTAPTALPSVIPPNPLGAVGGGIGAVRGEGVRVLLTCLKAGTAPLFYGSNNNVAASGNNAGKEIAPGAQDMVLVNDLAQIFVVSAANGTSTASWSVCSQ